MDRGGLNEPTDNACQWAFLCYIMFNEVKERVCRKSLTDIFMLVSDTHNFGMQKVHCRILANFFFKNYCKDMNPRSTKEASQKVLKLSEKN